MAANLSGGVVATGGNLVFQGDIDGRVKAYDAENGNVLWSFDAKTPVMAPPISYVVLLCSGQPAIRYRSYGRGHEPGVLGERLKKFGIDYRHQKRRVLTFALDGKPVLPDASPYSAFPQPPSPAAHKCSKATF